VKFSELNNDQKKLLILSIGGAITVLMIISNLVIKPAKKAAEKAEEIILEFGKEVSRGELLLKRDQRIRVQTREDAIAILKIYEEQLPPESSRYGWALDNLIGLSERAELEISVKEYKGTRYIPAQQGEKVDPDSIPMWIPYTLTVDTLTSFANLKNFLDLIKDEFPYCSVANIQISASDRDPENHSISFAIEWPVFRYSEDLAWIKAQAEGTAK
jgi:hypothetical protein